MTNPTVHELTLSEQDAKDAIIHINIFRKGRELEDTIYTVTFLEDDDDGTLFLEVYEDSNPDTSIANHYPEFFTMYQEDQHTHGLTTTVDGEII